MPTADNAFIPAHVAVIMDGNGRWAAQRGLPRFAGHHRGAERVKEVVKEARESGVKVLTLFAFSTENWSRPQAEIRMLMRYFHDFLHQELRGMQKNGIRLRVIGRRSKLPERLLKKITSIEELTANNSVLTLVLAIDYGARQEIIEAVKQVVSAARSNEIDLAEIDEQSFARCLYTDGLPDPDFLIRTSGEQRLSNFLLWQCSYAEFYFAKKMWPDFGAADFRAALVEFKKRKRRFGAAA
jgi:undecaprenyl diphosphate synthase